VRPLLGVELAESLELRSEHAPENEIYDSFTRPVKGEIAAHFMRMSVMAGVFAAGAGAEDEEASEEEE
jgi:hypothetical protein